MSSVLLVIHLMIALALIGVILLQRSEGGALGIGGGGNQQGRAKADGITKTTAVLAGIFFLTSIGLTIVDRNRTSDRSVLDRIQSDNPVSNTPKKSILDQLTPKAPTPPAPPSPSQ